MPTGRLPKWQILLTEFDIIYVTHTAIKAQALTDHLAEIPVDDEYMPLRTYFPYEEVNSIEEVVPDDNPVSKMYFDGASNIKGVGIGAILISPIGHHYPAMVRLRFVCTNNMAQYEACIMGLKMAIDLDVHELLVMEDFDLLIRVLLAYDGVILLQFVSHGDLIYSPPSELHPMFSPWPFIAWGMDVIWLIEPKALNGHRFILVAIDYFTKWVEVVTFKADTKKAVVDFVHSNIICRFGIPKTIITDNATNLNSHSMKEVCKQFKIMHRHSTPYRPKANGAIEAANKNIKKILRKMIQGSRKWHEKLPFALLGYRTTIRTSVGATPYLLVYGTEVVIPAEVEIPSL
ncbi:uncharacterized protein [Nicotiana sylvestris]|uniref:uncharacterized protein n=1 Tax=Nicotiana sylvestris TaxID=4096 RepID=UPI00388C9B63